MKKNNRFKKFKLNKNETIELVFWIILIVSLIFIFKDFIIGKLYYMYRDSGSDTVDQYYPYYINNYYF